MISSTSSEKDEHSEEMAAAAFIPEHLATGMWDSRDWKCYHRLRYAGLGERRSPVPAVTEMDGKSPFDFKGSRMCWLHGLGMDIPVFFLFSLPVGWDYNCKWSSCKFLIKLTRRSHSQQVHFSLCPLKWNTPPSVQARLSQGRRNGFTQSLTEPLITEEQGVFSMCCLTAGPG